MKLSELRLNDGASGLPKNPRFIKDGKFAKLVASVRDNPEFMPARPIIYDEAGVVLGGNMRLRACQEIGMADIPDDWAKQVVGWPVEKKRRFIILDNRGFGEDDINLLAADWDVDELLLAGFDEKELDAIFKDEEGEGDAEPPVDKAEELREKWGTELGQLWAVGNHRLMCGDSTDAETVAKLLDGSSPLMMVTDPPYGIEYDPSWRADAGINKNTEKMGNVLNDDIADWTPAWELFNGDVCYIYHAGVMSKTVQESLENCKFKIRAQIIWAKDRMALSRGDYHWQHEPCWYAVRDGKTGHRNDDRKQTTLWSIPARDDGGHGHGTQKPLECMLRPIRNHDCKEIYDPFLGSGTTMVACQNLNRKCYGLELNPAYVAVILERMITAFPDLKIHKVDA